MRSVENTLLLTCVVPFLLVPYRISILCTEKDSVTAEYALGGLSNNVFASRYVLYMPDKEQLVAQVETVIGKLHSNKS